MNNILDYPKSENSNEVPQWLLDRQASARSAFQAANMPTARDEAWRFSSVGTLTVDDFETFEGASQDLLSRFIERSDLVTDYSGRSIFVDDHQANFKGVDAELEQKGVIYLPIASAIGKHPALLQQYFLKEKKELGSEKFHEFHASSVRAGSFLYVPKGIVIDKPFVNYHWANNQKSAIFPHTLVVTEDNASVSIVDVFLSENKDIESLNVSASTIHAGSGSRISRTAIQNFSELTTSFQLDSTVAQRDAMVKNIAVNLGSKRARFENQTRIEGAGADVKMYSLTVADEKQEFDQRTQQIHNAPHAVSDLLYKNALLDSSRTIFSGLIKVAEGAQQTDAFQTNRNLLLDPTADANALPGLEILANDVRCSHGATTGNVDEDELFYMMQRGIPRRTAMQLLVSGFLEEIIEKIGNEELIGNVREMIFAKFKNKI